jgi:acylphosphatase
LPDGSVEATLEGEESKVMKLVAWAYRGPPRARVDSVKVDNQQIKNLRGFKIVG